jgi:hypothetical protein
VTEDSAVAGWALSEVVRGVPSAVVVSKRWVAGIALRKAGAPVLSSLPPIDGRNNDMVSCFPLQLRLELLQSVGFRDSEVEAYVIRPLTTFKLGQPQDLSTTSGSQFSSPHIITTLTPRYEEPVALELLILKGLGVQLG